jgi:hypothetical protein
VVEHSAHNGHVVGSIPTIWILYYNKIRVSPSGKARVFGALMHGFDSHYPNNKKNNNLKMYTIYEFQIN